MPGVFSELAPTEFAVTHAFTGGTQRQPHTFTHTFTGGTHRQPYKGAFAIQHGGSLEFAVGLALPTPHFIPFSQAIAWSQP